MPMFDQPGVHEIYRRWRQITDSYGVEGEDADRILCAEAWVLPVEQLAKYVRGDELHQSFNFGFLMAPWIAKELHAEITESLAAVSPYDAPQTWVLSNHDVVRHATRLGYEPQPGMLRMPGIGADDPQPDAEAGSAPSAGRDDRDARAARVGLPLPGRGARAAGGDPAARRAAPGPDLGALRPHQPWPGRVPGADPVGGRRAVVRLRPVGAVLAAPAGGLRRARSRPAGGCPRLDAGALPDAARGCAASTDWVAGS